jgi:hypothetical protein
MPPVTDQLLPDPANPSRGRCHGRADKKGHDDACPAPLTLASEDAVGAFTACGGVSDSDVAVSVEELLRPLEQERRAHIAAEERVSATREGEREARPRYC